MTALDAKAVRRLASQGWVDEKIGRKFGCSQYVVKHFRHKWKIPPRPLRVWPILDPEVVRSLIAAGMSDPKIAAHQGVCKHHVRRCREANDIYRGSVPNKGGPSMGMTGTRWRRENLSEKVIAALYRGQRYNRIAQKNGASQ